MKIRLFAHVHDSGPCRGVRTAPRIRAHLSAKGQNYVLDGVGDAHDINKGSPISVTCHKPPAPRQLVPCRDLTGPACFGEHVWESSGGMSLDAVPMGVRSQDSHRPVTAKVLPRALPSAHSSSSGFRLHSWRPCAPVFLRQQQCCSSNVPPADLAAACPLGLLAPHQAAVSTQARRCDVSARAWRG